MSNPTFAELVGMPFLGSIGDPWNFESDAGPGAIRGVIEAVSLPGDLPLWILCRVQAFRHDGTAITQVIAVARYRDQPVTNVASGANIGLNLVFDPSGASILPGRVSDLLRTKGLPFLVGSIQLATERA